MIYVLATLTIKPEARAEFITAALACIRETRKEAGNIAYDLHESVTDPAKAVFIEQWKDMDALVPHRTAEHVKAFSRVAARCVAGPPKIEYISPGSHWSRVNAAAIGFHESMPVGSRSFGVNDRPTPCTALSRFSPRASKVAINPRLTSVQDRSASQSQTRIRLRLAGGVVSSWLASIMGVRAGHLYLRAVASASKPCCSG